MPTAVMACGNSSRGTESLIEEFQAGDRKAVQLPDTKIIKSTVPGPARCTSNNTASRVPTLAWMASASRINRRRSVISASTPAGSEKRNIGRNTAVCTSAARNDDPLSCTIIQAAAMVCMALPTK